MIAKTACGPLKSAALQPTIPIHQSLYFTAPLIISNCIELISNVRIVYFHLAHTGCWANVEKTLGTGHAPSTTTTIK